MSESLSLTTLPDSKFIEGLSHEPFIMEVARWLVDKTYEVTYQPDRGNVFHYVDRIYGVSQDKTARALEIAQDRIMEELNNGQA